ncbi:MAG: AarF/ABC1/UbiB kinase family protein [Deltaproteobacteria bacterium]|nr:AarF/ABC1/UbiB kinase family protein [Deltaproteobacteria bacterium]MBI2992300.1 AarF/ABC1/UbiB kinase family protein [Deltaproteobacteria bacterium]
MKPVGLFRIRRTYRNLGRFRDIVNVFLKHGLGQIIEWLEIEQFAPIRWWYKPLHKQLEREEAVNLPERLRIALEELGPTFIKFGQLLSTRPDIVPREYVKAFDLLLDQVPPFPSEQARRIIESELQAPIAELVAKFDDTPLAAASIAQVHRATLWSGEEVVFKVRRPGIQEVIKQDIDILHRVADLIERYVPDLAFLNARGLVEEFEQVIQEEMDFLREAENASRFRANFEGSRELYVPKVFLHLTTEQVLVMEYLEGARIDDLDKLRETGVDLDKLARRGSEVLFKMILTDGFFHADPHPGNFLVLSNGQLGFVDFGVVGRIREDLLDAMGSTFIGLLNRDYDALTRQSINLGFVPESVDLERYRQEMRGDLENTIEPLVGRKLSQIPPMVYVERIMGLALKHHLRLPRELFLVGKCLVLFEGLFRRLSPELDFFAVARPYARRLITQRSILGTFTRKLRREAMDLLDVASALPREIHLALRKLTRNDIQVKLHLMGLDPYVRRLDRASNRLTFAVIISAIIVGSSIIIPAARDAAALQWLVIGGFVVGILLALWLIIGIMRSGML